MISQRPDRLFGGFVLEFEKLKTVKAFIAFPFYLLCACACLIVFAAGLPVYLVLHASKNPEDEE